MYKPMYVLTYILFFVLHNDIGLYVLSYTIFFYILHYYISLCINLHNKFVLHNYIYNRSMY